MQSQVEKNTVTASQYSKGPLQPPGRHPQSQGAPRRQDFRPVMAKRHSFKSFFSTESGTLSRAALLNE